MFFPVANPLFETDLFAGLLLLTLAIFCRKRKELFGLSTRVSTELKGLAILAVIFSHIGYFLAEDHRFLFPLSTGGGVGVDLFLLLSGYGLAYSMMRKQTSILTFYKKRVSRIFIPLWIVLVVLLIADKIVLNLGYSLTSIIQSFLGFFPRADLYANMDSPLWYLTLILFFYLLFPIVFFKKAPWLSAFLLAAIGLFVTLLPLPVNPSVLAMYQTHLLGFPLGVLCASILNFKGSHLAEQCHRILRSLQRKPKWLMILRISLTIIFLGISGYTLVYSEVGHGVILEELVSLLTACCLTLAFMVKPFENRFLALVGMYSYEIYLFHWPLMYHFDFLYIHLPPAIATFLYLIVFLALGWLVQRLVRFFLPTTPSSST